MHTVTNLIVLRANFGCKTLQRLVVEQPIQRDYFSMKFISDVSKDIILIAQHARTFFDGHKITHSCMIFVFMAQFIPPNATQFVFFLHTVRIGCLDLPFSLKKRKQKVKVTLIGYFNDCLFTATSTVPAQAA